MTPAFTLQLSLTGEAAVTDNKLVDSSMVKFEEPIEQPANAPLIYVNNT